MKSLQKHVIGLLIAFGLLLGFMPATSALAETTYEVWVQGIQVTEANKNDILGDGTVRYNDTESKLILNNAKLTARDVDKALLQNPLPGSYHAAIFTKIPLTIEISGDNTITTGDNISLIPDRAAFLNLIYGYKTAVTISGEGKLTIQGDGERLLIRGIGAQDLTITDKVKLDIEVSNQKKSNHSIFTQKNLTINGQPTVNLKAEGMYASGIYCIEEAFIGGKATINISGNGRCGIESSANLKIGDKAQVNIAIDQGYSAGIYFDTSNREGLITDEATVKINVTGKESQGIERSFKSNTLTIEKNAVLNSIAQGEDSYGIAQDSDKAITLIKTPAQVTAAGDKKAFEKSLDLSKYPNPLVLVAEKQDGTGAILWDGHTALSGEDSPYQYVKIDQSLYAIKFDENYTDSNPPSTYPTDSTGKIVPHWPQDPVRENHIFLGWNTKADGTGDVVKSDYSFIGDTTLYAQWKPQFQVTFNDNYSGAPAPKVLIADSNDKVSPWPQDPVRENHTFLGWNTDPNGSGEMVGPDHAFDNNTTLYAQWKLNIPVTFDWNGAEAATTTIYTNSTGKISAYPEVPNYGDYRFSGWNTARDGSGTAITKDHVFTTDTTLYAQWLKSERGGNKTYGDYSGNGTGPLVNFDPNYADAPAAESKRADKNGKFAQLPAPKREGHLFLGWFKDKDGSGTALTADHVFTNGETVYAKWADGKDALRVIMTIGSHDYLVNDVAKTMDTVPFIENDRTFVPIRALAEAFGAEVIWDGNERSVTIKDGDKTVLMIIGDKSYRVNDESKEMDVAPFINKDNRTMIPVRFATEALGYQVDYQQKDEVAKVIFTRG